MKRIFVIFVVTLSLSLAVFAQTNPSATSTPAAKPKTPIFRANKEQVMEAQKTLKVAETGKLDDATRAAIKTFQSGNGLKATGALNRATLEKMNIRLTDKQKEIPVSANSFAAAGGGEKSKSSKPRGAVFRASKDQIMEAQKMLKDKSLYAGEMNGKLDDATRDGIKKWQTANGVKSTGTLNKETLEKMGIALTDKQKAM